MNLSLSSATVLIEAELQGSVSETELFSESLQNDELAGPYYNCPGFIVANTQEELIKKRELPEKLYRYYKSLNKDNIEWMFIVADEYKTIPLTENMRFTYSSGRDVYTVFDSNVPNDKRYNWQSFAQCGYGVKLQEVGNQKRSETRSFLRSQFGSTLKWTFEPKPESKPVLVNNLLVYVNSDDDVQWQLKIWTSDNASETTVNLTPKDEKFDQLGKNVTKIELIGDMRDSKDKAKVFEENVLKNETSLLVAINKATEIYLDNNGKPKNSLPAPSVQSKHKAFILLPDENGTCSFKYRKTDDSNQAKVCKLNNKISFLSLHLIMFADSR